MMTILYPCWWRAWRAEGTEEWNHCQSVGEVAKDFPEVVLMRVESKSKAAMRTGRGRGEERGEEEDSGMALVALEVVEAAVAAVAAVAAGGRTCRCRRPTSYMSHSWLGGMKG